ncbi:hypothetical protein PG985_004845 [Apiospora marii]|uniref:uncharacterized protein n=1 Tax=Apiospora marii TaxID=335849 RepID=UPI00312DA713
MSQPQSSDLETQAKALLPTSREARYWDLQKDILERAKEVQYTKSARPCMSVDNAEEIMNIRKLPRALRIEKTQIYRARLDAEMLKEIYFFLHKVLDALVFLIENEHEDDPVQASFLVIISHYLEPFLQLQMKGEVLKHGTYSLNRSE